MWFPRRAAALPRVDALAAAASAGSDDKAQRQRRQKRDKLALTTADLTTVGAGGGEAKKDSAGRDSPRWWSPREWWKGRSVRRASPRFTEAPKEMVAT